MRFTGLYPVFILLFLVPGVSAGGLPVDGHTVDEWKEILKVSPDQNRLIGLMLDCTIYPDLYYQNTGDITLTGRLQSVFGPVADEPVDLLQVNESADVLIGQNVTDEEGFVTFVIPGSDQGPTRYQLRFTTNGTLKADVIESRAYEVVSGYLPEAAVTGDTGKTSSQDTPSALLQPDHTRTQSESSAGPTLTLDVAPEQNSFGDNVTFSGYLRTDRGTSLSRNSIFLRESPDSEILPGMPVQTGTDGSYAVSYHLPGTGDLTVRAVSTGQKTGAILSDARSLTWDRNGYTPPVKVIPSRRQIDLSVSASQALPGENLTVYGWFLVAGGDPVIRAAPGLFQYNIHDGGWDRFEETTDALTDRNGGFVIRTNAPDLPGQYYLAAISLDEPGNRPLFSNLLALTVVSPAGDLPVPAPGISLEIRADPPLVSPGNTTRITFSLHDTTGSPLGGENLSLLFSEDGFTWMYSEDGSAITDTDGQFSLNDTPKKEGYHYYRAIFAGTDTLPAAESDTLVIPVLSSP